MKKRGSKNASKNGAPPDSNNTLSVGQEAPGEAASRARCTDKKQLFEQQLRHFLRFLPNKSGLGSKFVWKTDRTTESLQQKLSGLLTVC